MIRIGIVGVGYWGPNLLRCFNDHPEAQVSAVCDLNQSHLRSATSHYPNVQTFSDYDEMLARQVCDAIVIATPTRSHFHLARKALEHDLHVFVEKPLAKTSHECMELIEIADLRNRLLFVGHVFLHSAPVAKLREIVASGELGNINYISSRRLNLGPVRQDVSALYDLAPHDISMMLYLLGEQPLSTTCTGFDRLHPGIHDVCNLSLKFSDNRMGMIHVSWLDPRKERVLTIVGDKKMAVYDDLEQERIKIYDKGIDQPPRTNGDFADFQISYRYGGSYSPFVQEREPLKVQCSEFVRCILEGDVPLTDGINGLQVVQVLEAADQSLHSGGHPVPLIESQYVAN